MEYLIFKAGENLIGLDVLKVEEIILSRNRGPSPASNSLKYNGKEYMLYDPSMDLYSTVGPLPEKYAAILCNPGKPIGLVADSAEEILKVAENELRDAGEASPDIDKALLDGIIIQDNRKIHILSFEKLTKLIIQRQ
jgi:chemotaxis signal transduction protein